MTIDHIREYDSQLSQLNTRLKPLGDRHYTMRLENYVGPLDELGVQPEVFVLMIAIITPG
jgi:hypothetical protein